MKNKTSLSITIFAISLLIIPQMTFAAWWKPGTWKIFNRKAEVKIEQKIIATSTPNNIISQTEKATMTPTISRSSNQSVGAEKIEQKSEEAGKPKATSSLADTSAQKSDQSKEIEKLKKELEALKQKQSQIKAVEKTIEKPITAEKKESSSSQTKQNESIVTLPNGAVVEMDANGNITRTIKDAPQPTYIDITKNTEILSVSLEQALTMYDSAYLSWTTNLPSDSKIFWQPSDSSNSTKITPSESGYSTKHIVHLSNLTHNTEYSYSIESIFGQQSKKILGTFTTPFKFIILNAKLTGDYNKEFMYIDTNFPINFHATRLVPIDVDSKIYNLDFNLDGLSTTAQKNNDGTYSYYWMLNQPFLRNLPWVNSATFGNFKIVITSSDGVEFTSQSFSIPWRSSSDGPIDITVHF